MNTGFLGESCVCLTHPPSQPTSWHGLFIQLHFILPSMHSSRDCDYMVYVQILVSLSSTPHPSSEAQSEMSRQSLTSDIATHGPQRMNPEHFSFRATSRSQVLVVHWNISTYAPWINTRFRHSWSPGHASYCDAFVVPKCFLQCY